jgi:hypothetical protein
MHGCLARYRSRSRLAGPCVVRPRRASVAHRAAGLFRRAARSARAAFETGADGARGRSREVCRDLSGSGHEVWPARVSVPGERSVSRSAIVAIRLGQSPPRSPGPWPPTPPRSPLDPAAGGPPRPGHRGATAGGGSQARVGLCPEQARVDGQDLVERRVERGQGVDRAESVGRGYARPGAGVRGG